MAFDFPTSPAVDDEYSSGGITYVWTGNCWDIKGSGDLSDYVLRAGDTMVGALTVQASPTNGGVALRLPNGAEPGHIAWLNGDGTRKAWMGAGAGTDLALTLDAATRLAVNGGSFAMGDGVGIHWGNTSAKTDVNDFSEGLCLYGWGTTSQFGFNITSGTLNASIQNAANKFDVNVGGVNKLSVQNITSYFNTNLGVSGTTDLIGTLTIRSAISLDSAYISCPEGSKIQFNSASMFISSTANKNIRYDVGDTAEHGMWVNGTKEFWVSSAGHGLRMPDSFAKDIGVPRDADGGVNMRETLVALLAKIKVMEAEIASLKARR